MALPRFLRRGHVTPENPQPASESAKPVTVRRPPPAALRRERRELERLRDERLRDLGGLLLEMYRRSDVREELLSERCADLVAIDARLAEIHALLTTPRRHAAHCACGAALLPGARFCPSCGREVAPKPVQAAVGEDTVIEPPPSSAE